MGILTTSLHYTPHSLISLLQGHTGQKREGIRNFLLKLYPWPYKALLIAVSYIFYMINKGITSYDKYIGYMEYIYSIDKGYLRPSRPKFKSMSRIQIELTNCYSPISVFQFLHHIE